VVVYVHDSDYVHVYDHVQVQVHVQAIVGPATFVRILHPLRSEPPATD